MLYDYQQYPGHQGGNQVKKVEAAAPPEFLGYVDQNFE